LPAVTPARFQPRMVETGPRPIRAGSIRACSRRAPRV
jgi:hypothetical protein